MRGKKHTEEQIIAILKQTENGLKTAEVCRQHGGSEQTLYRWKAKYGGMEGSDSRKLKEVLDENRKLKSMVAELSLDNRALKGCAVKKLVEPAGRREAAKYMEQTYRMSE